MFLDSLRSAIAAVNPFARQQVGMVGPGGMLTSQAAILAYLSSGMLRKVIAIPAHDRVREWRDWQAEQDQIEAIEAEERRLGLVAKVRFAEVLRGIGGGALILAAPGDPALPINFRALGKGQLAAVNVVTRWQITGLDWVREITDPAYGTPRMWQVSGDGRQQRIQPSRVITFRGDPLPSMGTIGDEEAYWGDSRLVRVMREVSNADNAQLWFAELIKKAKLLRIGIGDLEDYLGTDTGRAKLASRIQLISEGESSINATVYRLGSTAGSGKDLGEKIDDYQVTWAGIPAMMDAFNAQLAAVADIPQTRLFGRAPAGMNATGESDLANYNAMVAAGQNLELRPCLEQLDEALIRSAGVDPKGIYWRYSPLTTPSEKEEADRFSTTMEAVTKLQATATIPDEALTKAVQNLMSENGWLPGLDGALAELPEDERFGLNTDPDDTDPSALTQGEEVIEPSAEGGASMEAEPRRRAANDKVPGVGE